MFMGFIDGDGYFYIGEQKQYKRGTKTLVKSTIIIRLAYKVVQLSQKVVSFFSLSNNHPLYGYKLSQYIIWLTALKSVALCSD